MKILVACEESQAITIEMRKLWIEAYSCDIQECSWGHPEWHIQWDTIKEAYSGKYDMMIAHPPCTDLAVSGARHFAIKIADWRQQRSIDFFMKLANAPIKYIAIENPVCIMSSKWRKPDQIIQPYMFWEPFKKTTCLWLKNIPNLIPTDIVPVSDFKEYKCKNWKTARFSNWINEWWKDRQKIRSKTFPWIAKAIAEQWGKLEP